MNGYEKALEDIKQIPVLTAEIEELESKIGMSNAEIYRLQAKKVLLENLFKKESQIRMLEDETDEEESI